MTTPRQDIAVDDLQIGMTVCKLDISWIDSPFLFHKRKIRSDEDINALKKAGCRRVTVIPPEEHALESPDVAAPNAAAGASPEDSSVDAHIMGDTLPEQRDVQLGAELQAATAIKNKMLATTRNMFAAINQGEPIDVEPLLPMMDKTLASMSRNESALLALLQNQRKSERLLEHAFAVFTLCIALSRRMGLSEPEQQALAVAAILHDCGWLKLPVQLFGSKKAWQPKELVLIRQHPQLSVTAMTSGSAQDALMLRLVQEHEERWNGSGFPQGLSATALHPLSAVIQLADQYDELVHGLQDKPAITPHAALSQLFRMSQQGVHSSDICKHLVNLLGVYPVGCALQLSTGEKAIVIASHHEHPKLPQIRILYDHRGQPLPSPLELNMADQGETEVREISAALSLYDHHVDPADIIHL